jgi:acetyltransferase-like isoleucine patch superfamily enzyme
MRAVGEVGVGRVLRYAWTRVLLGVLRLMWLPPLRALFLRLCGARVGAGTVIERLTVINADRGGFGGLTIGAHCFIGDETLIDLAGPIQLEDHTTLAARAMLLTHLNVGYHDHPLQAAYPSMVAGITVRQGSYVGAGATILAGCAIGPRAFVGAASLVNHDVAADTTVAGVPARVIATRA